MTKKILLTTLLPTACTTSYFLTSTYKSRADDALNSKKAKDFWEEQELWKY